VMDREGVRRHAAAASIVEAQDREAEGSGGSLHCCEARDREVEGGGSLHY
jgi:hypothetical protein